MADPEHLKIFKQGVKAFNEWREENPDIVPNLIEANLSGADLGGANLRGANLSRAIVNEITLQQTEYVKGGQIGINGIWASFSDTSALMTLTPPGNSMTGNNPEAVIESLRRARKLHGLSMSLIGVFFLIILLGLTDRNTISLC
jgi:hypothetical protein